MSRLIDGDALMPKLKFILEAENQIYRRESWGFTAKCINAVEDAPTIEERKTGKWLPDNNNYIEGRFICSVCGKSYKVDTCMGKPMWDFCPCGAKMEEGDRT